MVILGQNMSQNINLSLSAARMSYSRKTHNSQSATQKQVISVVSTNQVPVVDRKGIEMNTKLTCIRSCPTASSKY
jgi:hypothetical protein